MQMGWGYAPPYTTPGGHALKFFASLRVECKAGAKNEQGRWTRAKCVKNKVSSPFREGKFFIDYKKGFDSEYEIYEIVKDKKIIIASGAWWRFSNDEANKTFGTVSGWTKVIDRLRVDEDYKSAMLQLIYMSGGALVEASSGSESFDKEES
jgi:recombination protein RecA